MFVSIYSMFTDSSSKEKDLDVTSFRAEIANKDKAKDIEQIQIEPKGHQDARYTISYKSTPTKSVVNAEFNDSITNEIYGAGIKYKVASKDDSSIWPQVLV